MKIAEASDELVESIDKINAFLHENFEGITDDDYKAWRKFWNRLFKAPAKTLINIDLYFPRNGKYHRKFLAMLRFAFNNWDMPIEGVEMGDYHVLKDFESFREDITIRAGYYEATFGIDGSVKLKAQSISFAKMDDAKFERVYSRVVDVILQDILTKYKDRDEFDQVLQEAVGFI